DVRYFFYIGGNDSAQTAAIVNRISRDANYELRVFHVPKTIDNDLLVTDHCPGYGSAAKFVASAFIGDDLDNRALQGVKINIIMGRNAGFLTASSVLARMRPDDGPHLVYLPERPFDLDQFVKDVSVVNEQFGRCVVAISEGIIDAQGKLWSQKVLEMVKQSAPTYDPHGNVEISAGAGMLADYLANTVRSRCKIKRVRADTFGYLQRSFPGFYSTVDAWEARLVGQMAVSYSLQSEDRDGSVALVRLPGTTYAVGTKLVGLKEVAPMRRRSPRWCRTSTSARKATTYSTTTGNMSARWSAICPNRAGSSRLGEKPPRLQAEIHGRILRVSSPAVPVAAKRSCRRRSAAYGRGHGRPHR
ncbi:MAG: diphosphate--fructose-6-phosphate 1-phosphotransferase, partial [Planctomycetes bacterium]|nr:diphosphate--fructose-6-phosphate 1-phosphotransferase [Planctomycetota bacterium]